MQEQRSSGWDGRLIAAPAGLGLVGLGEHLREMRRGWEQAEHRVRRAALAWQAARVSHGATGIRCQALVNLKAEIHADTDCAADPLTGKDGVQVHETGIAADARPR